jgi:putative drug exporter of the RND superfamily
MFFVWLGQTVRRGWPFLLAGWVILLVGTRLAAPPWGQYAQDKEFDFLPDDAPSRRAEKIYPTAFPEDQSRSTIALVLHRKDNEPGHLDRDKQFISDVLEPALRKIADSEGGLAAEAVPDEGPLFGDDDKKPKQSKNRSIIARIRTPNARGAGALLVSPDERALLVVLELTTEFLTNTNWPTIARVEQLVAELKQQGKLPPGADLAITGSAVVGRDHTRAERDSARATELLTIILVIALLVIIYRAPLLALIPLATVYLAVQLSLNVLAIMARWEWITLFRGIEIYITILAYGAGVDYCLFLTARYKEELDRFHPADAVAGAVEGVGAALVASAATVICGIAMMMFAEFGKFRQAGFAIPLSLVLVLCATLTFSSSLLRLAGRWAFWPWHPRQAMGDGHPVAPPGPDGQPDRRGLLERM